MVGRAHLSGWACNQFSPVQKPPGIAPHWLLSPVPAVLQGKILGKSHPEEPLPPPRLLQAQLSSPAPLFQTSVKNGSPAPLHFCFLSPVLPYNTGLKQQGVTLCLSTPKWVPGLQGEWHCQGDVPVLGPRGSGHPTFSDHPWACHGTLQKGRKKGGSHS